MIGSDYTINENGEILVSGPIGGSGVAGQVAFWTAVQTLSGDNNLQWDNVNGRLGVNVAVPTSTVDIYETASVAIITATMDNDALPPAMTYQRSRSGMVIVQDDDPLGQLTFRGYDGVSYKNAARIRAEVDNVPGVSDMPGRILFYTTPDGSSTLMERVRIDNAGLTGFNVVPVIRIHGMEDNVSNSVVIPVARFEGQVDGGAGAVGHGPSIELTGESSTTENQSMTKIASRWSVATHASRRARVEIRVAYIGTDVLCGVIEAPFTGSADGNSRGVGAVDFQGWRAAATDVASGDFAVLGGGQGNEASGDRSFVNGGMQAKADKWGQYAHGAGAFGSVGIGTAQFSRFVARRDIASHSVGTWYSLWLDESSAQMTIPASTAWTVEVMVIGITANSAQQWGYLLYGLIERDNANNTTMAASGKAQTIFESDANYDVTIVADDANEALEVQVRRTGGVDYSVRWVAVIRTVECTHA